MKTADIAEALTALADLAFGYSVPELNRGWKSAAKRLADELHAKGVRDDGTWAIFNPKGAAETNAEVQAQPGRARH